MKNNELKKWSVGIFHFTFGQLGYWSERAKEANINPIRPGLFSRSPGPEEGLRGPDAKNQGQHQPIEMKRGMSHYAHKSIPDAKFESGSSFSF